MEDSNVSQLSYQWWRVNKYKNLLCTFEICCITYQTQRLLFSEVVLDIQFQIFTSAKTLKAPFTELSLSALHTLPSDVEESLTRATSQLRSAGRANRERNTTYANYHVLCMYYGHQRVCIMSFKEIQENPCWYIVTLPVNNVVRHKSTHNDSY